MWSGELNNGHPEVNGITYWNWHVCDGTYPTPDLREKFIMGAGGNHPINTEGGSASSPITGDNLPYHNHILNNDGSTTFSGSHAHKSNIKAVTPLSSAAFEGNPTEYSAIKVTIGPDGIDGIPGGSHGHELQGVTGYTGSAPAEPIETIPPYYSLVFLMYVEPE